MAIAIAINAVVQNILGQHLHHANLACPSAGGGGRVEIAAFEQGDGGQQLWPKQRRSAAIMGQGGQRIGGVEIALKGTVIGFKGPKRQQNPPWDAILCLDPGENRIPFAAHFSAAAGPVFRNQTAGKAGKIQLKNTLPPVGG